MVVVGTERGASGSGGNTLDCGGEGRAASLEGRRLAASQAPANLSRLVDINNRSTLRYLLLCSSPSTSQPNHREHFSSSGHSSSLRPSFPPSRPDLQTPADVRQYPKKNQGFQMAGHLSPTNTQGSINTPPSLPLLPNILENMAHPHITPTLVTLCPTGPRSRHHQVYQSPRSKSSFTHGKNAQEPSAALLNGFE